MTAAEFFSCSLLAFGAPLAMFALTIANDPVRIIIMIAAAFFWLLSFLLSSMLWYAVVPLRSYLAFGMVFAILIQVRWNHIIFNILHILYLEAKYYFAFRRLFALVCIFY